MMVATESATIPASHVDLFLRPIHGVLVTMMPDGQPQASVVWVDYDGTHVLLNTTLERQKGKNMGANPRVTLLVVDPDNTSRWIEVRGRVVQITSAGAVSHAERLTQRYSHGNKRPFYGDAYPPSQTLKETRVTIKVAPTHIALDAIFR